MKRTLEPIVHRDAYNAGVEREILAWFREAIFTPLLLVLDEAGVPVDAKNQAIKDDEFGRANAATSAIEAALSEGRIFYADGVFSGKFSSRITRELRALGATFDASTRTFRLADAAIPFEIRGALADASERSAAVTKSVLGTLDEILANVGAADAGLQLAAVLTRIEDDLGRQLVATTVSLSPERIGLKPSIDVETREVLDAGFTNNLELSIKNFAAERIPEMRRRVEENAFKFGGRTDRLARILEAEFGVAKRKAEFLADQETGLLVSKYRAAKYKQLGIRDYIWSTSHDSRVRDSHRVLDGKRFSFDAPPIVDAKTGRRCNPGEDYRCRCVPRPLINLAEIAA